MGPSEVAGIFHNFRGLFGCAILAQCCQCYSNEVEFHALFVGCREVDRCSDSNVIIKATTDVIARASKNYFANVIEEVGGSFE